MGRHPTAGAVPAPGETLDDRPRLRRLDGDAGDRRSGDAVEIGRPCRHPCLYARRPVRARRVQGRPSQFPVLGWPAAPAGAARRRTLARLGIAAAGFPAPILRARYARNRRARDEMPNGLIAPVAITLLCAAQIAAAGIAAADTIYVSNE